jgi:AcrR family transcriptional regulator
MASQPRLTTPGEPTGQSRHSGDAGDSPSAP